ncbi:MAG: hypothetical protein HFJ35_02665 [Clostridia bacterium]|nr:hypothetical protein [Clostridia bacterium]
MQEIEDGEYVRLNYGKIDKVKNTDYMQQYIECENGLYPRENIEKHSKNIIDLIEIGDYVNKHLIINIEIDENKKQKIITTNKYMNEYLHNGLEKIETIATREQMAIIEYKI